MVARGDLGIECPLEDVPHLQKRIVRHCVEVGVPVITATQMLESMITAPSPTRAEVSDIANAVFDGTDALMLSAETAIGHDPVTSSRTMVTDRRAGRGRSELRAVGRAASAGMQRDQWPEGPDRITMAITHAAGLAAVDAGADAILCCTRSGRTARAMARFRPTPHADRFVARPADRAHDGAVVGRHAAPGVDTYTIDRRAGLVRDRDGGARRAWSQSGQIVLVLAGAPDRPSGASPTCCASCRVDVSCTMWADEAGDADASARRADPRLDGSLVGDAEAQPPARRRLPGPALRPARLRALVPQHAGSVHDGRRRWPTWSSCWPVARRCWSGTATAATSRWLPPSVTPIWCRASRSTRRRCRGCRGGPAPPLERSRSPTSGSRRKPPSGSCGGWSATTVGGAARADQRARRAEGVGDGRRAGRSARNRPWHRRTTSVPVLAGTAGSARPIIATGCEHAATMLGARSSSSPTAATTRR